MNLDLTVPFGLKEGTDELLDVTQVAQGKPCNCVCPSCKTPLIAHQGEQLVWHFAHASRSVYSKTERQCAFSYFVSVRMMVRQIIGSNFVMALPAYEGKTYHQFPDGYRAVFFPVCAPQTITLANIQVEKVFDNSLVDIHGYVGGVDFSVYLVHPGREVPPELHQPKSDRCGIIAIALDKLPRCFNDGRAAGVTYKETLRRFLADDTASKLWIYHPRYERQRRSAIEEQERIVATYISKSKARRRQR